LREALDIVAELGETLELNKEVDLEAELQKVKNLYPSCSDFEREFPSICFSIATGVGKTRLMGACIAYLYLEKGIRNFFVLAPNLTIYNKLIEDFGNPGYHKYVFNGISEFVHNRPVIITGDNYNQMGNLFKESEIRINVFNIAKFNSENRATRSKGVSLPPRIKRLSEVLGQSYWSYLSGLDDLVILMDEAHRYHADASRNAINELKPVFGIELTATPIDEKGNAFRNVVYEYSLAKALEDGKYVKNPAIATRKNFRPQGLTDKEIEIIKLEDAISIHEDTKNELEIYARNNEVERVKPFVLVVCRDISHAKEVFDYVSSIQFFNGYYRGKVLQIDSSTRSQEEVEAQFITLESTDNEIEIVIHVNMLKEGWDVTNLYTIVPLRAANAAVLVEQTIGRGLRLPYNGERTGDDKVDKLTVVAHENFEKVIEAAQDPNSVLNKLSYIEIPDEEFKTKATVVSSVSRNQAEVEAEEKAILEIKDEKAKADARTHLDAKKAILSILPTFNAEEGVKKVADLEKPEVKKAALYKVKQQLARASNLFADQILEEAAAAYDTVVTSFRKNIIEIPRMDLVQEEVEVWFDDFDLDVSNGFDFRIMEEEIMRRGLKDNLVDTIGVRQGAFTKETPLNQLVSELINFPEIDYDDNAELLNKLALQAINHLNDLLDDSKELPLLIRQYRKVIAGKIYDQMKRHFHVSEPDYGTPNVLPFVKIEDWNFTVVSGYGYKDYRETVTPVNTIPKYVFRGFEKACHFEYKFDSKTEKDLAYILENDKHVVKWLRPAPNQFRIYWANNSRQYYPDFVVETEDTLYLVETKAEDQMQAEDVLNKKAAALKYCKYATEFTVANGGKPWKYMLVPHNEVNLSTGFKYLERFGEE
ncbi:MAG: DEAD/DEAH box helicase, partial [Mariniphaga sp.]